MEYSPMMVVMLWALTPSDCWPIDSGVGEQARVVEMPQPVMSVHPEGGYFTFNHGRPFFVERNPLTGAIDSNIKTTKVASNYDYLYEDFEDSGESIDRKDSTKLYTRNDISSPTKEADLHKFLNLPVHYSSSGKFPLISSSYANTKVQGHGPLSNHKLQSSGSTTTSTISPSYFTYKDTTSSTTTTKQPLTTKSIVNTTLITSPKPILSSTTTTTAATTTTRTSTTTTAATTTTKTTNPTTYLTTKITTTLKPFFSNYEYEYDYDYDKNDGENAENTSQDYEFLGASSEILKPNDKTSTPNNSESNLTKEESSVISATSTSTPPKMSVFGNASIKMNETSLAKEKESENNSKKGSVVVNTTMKQEDTIDLRPPSPVISVDLKPPQLQSNDRPYSSVLPNKLQNYGQPGFVRYPESSVIAGDKRPVTFYTPQNITKPKPPMVVTASNSQPSALNKHPQVEKMNTSIPPRPHGVEILHSYPTDKTSSEENTASSTKLNISQTDRVKGGKPFQQIKNSLVIKPGIFSSDKSNVAGGLSTLPGNAAKPLVDSKPSESSSIIDQKRPQDIVSGGHIRQEETVLDYNKHHQGVLLKPDYLRPQGGTLTHTNKLVGTSLISNSRPQNTDQGHAKPPAPVYEKMPPSATANVDILKLKRPQGGNLADKRRPPMINVSPDVGRPVGSIHFAQNSKPYVPYSHEHHTTAQHYHHVLVDSNRPQNSVFGLRTERPQGSDRPLGIEQMRPQGSDRPLGLEQMRPQGSDRPLGIEQMRPHVISNVQIMPHEQKKTDVRPLQIMSVGEVIQGEKSSRPEASTKPVIFSKPQTSKRPDYNTVQFGQPSKVENHFISVSSGNDNPSYSLQTSFSIGVPPPGQNQPLSSGGSGGGHSVGQVLFPDEDVKAPAAVWAHQRLPQIVQPENHANIQIEKYPRPPWESHIKPPYIHQKKEPFPPIKRKPLPNILPQFRPNAKIGHAEPHIYLKPREPYDTLQPPPLPRPQFLRVEPDMEENKPLVHRRNGQGNSRVTTLQMMQGSPPSKRASLRIDESNEKNEPVFVVYPSNGGNAGGPPSDGVVVGTRGPHRPLPPDNLDISEDLDSFPLDNNKNFQARVDTPVLKSKPPTSKPPIKNDFPYALIKPNEEDRITLGSVVTKEYTAFSPTVPSIEKEHDTEINIIPYLQDYMPFATKKPLHQKESWVLGNDVKNVPAASGSKPLNVEVTQTPQRNENHRVVSEGPQPQDFQAPFHASLTAPSQGWSVVQKKPNKENNSEETTTTKESNEPPTTQEPKFDIQNFKPQLFGGFKPIVPQIDTEKKESTLL